MKDFRSMSEKVAYLKGMLEGMNNEDKITSLIVDILSDLAYEIEDTQDDLYETAQNVAELEGSISDIEDFLEECCDDEDCDCCHGHSHDFDECEYDDEDDDDEYDELFDDDEELYEVTCPTCSDTICLNEDMLEEGSITCPNCGELLEFGLDDEEDEEGSDGGEEE